MTEPTQNDPPAGIPPVPPAATPAATPVFAGKPAETAKPAAAKPSPAVASTPAPRPSSGPPPGAAPRPQPAPAGRAQPQRSALAVLSAIGFVLLLVAFGWVWTNQRDMAQQIATLSVPPPPPPAPPPSVDPARVAALETRLKGLEQRLSELENRPAPVAPAPAPAPVVDNSAALAAQAAVTALEQRLKDDEQRQTAQAAKTAVSQRLQVAALALDAGDEIGDLPGAPPALARFAHAKPPTEAALRLSFPAAAEAAETASRPSTEGKSLGERILLHASSLVTVRQGATVVVGAPASTVLGAAQAKLDVGDLAGAVAALDGLDSGAAQAMAAWRGDAQALLDARAALARMARS
jgi:hypothetical protein